MAEAQVTVGGTAESGLGSHLAPEKKGFFARKLSRKKKGKSKEEAPVKVRLLCTIHF